MPERLRVLASLALIALAVGAGCGKKGPLYLPDSPGDVVNDSPPPPSESGSPSNSPSSVDSPPAPPNPAPEVTEPEDESTRKKEGAGSPPPR